MDETDYEQIVAAYHEDLYRFAFSLAADRDDACELTQETYVRLLTKSGQLRDRRKVKAWLFTTLYRVFLGWKRHSNRFVHVEISSVEGELPHVTPQIAEQADEQTVLAAAMEIDEHYRAPLMLYYVQGLNYREVAKVLDVPIGTIMSRLSRGKALLRQRLAARLPKSGDNILPFTQTCPNQSK